MKKWIILSLFLFGCNTSEETWQKETVMSRGEMRKPLFEMKVPSSWERLPESQSINDTREPIASWRINKNTLITMHNFPGMQIPAASQVQRWERQMAPISPTKISIKPVSWGGFEGLLFQARGDKKVLAYAMHNPVENWTFKATGDIDEKEEEIKQVAHTIRLIVDL